MIHWLTSKDEKTYIITTAPVAPAAAHATDSIVIESPTLKKLSWSGSTAKTEAGGNGVTVSISSNQTQLPQIPRSPGISVTTDHFQTFEKRDLGDAGIEMAQKEAEERPTTTNMFDRADRKRHNAPVSMDPRDITLSLSSTSATASELAPRLSSERSKEPGIGGEAETIETAMPNTERDHVS
jgi:hypothetical protein